MGLSAALWMAVVIWSAAGCDFARGVTGSSAGPTPPPTPLRGALPGLAPGTPSTELTLYFPRYLEDESLGLSATRRAVPNSDLPKMALEALIQGPDGDERAADYAYPLSPRTKVLTFRLDDGVAQVELNSELEKVRGKPFSELAYWSIVFTLTEVPGVRGVSLLRDSQPLREFGYPSFTIPEIASSADAPAWARPR